LDREAVTLSSGSVLRAFFPKGSKSAMLRLWRKVGVALLRFGRRTGSHGMTQGGGSHANLDCRLRMQRHAQYFGSRARGTVRPTLCIIAGGARISSVVVAHTVRASFTPASGRVVGSGLWQAKTPKSCSLASGPTPRESPSATSCFYRCAIVTTTPFALILNTSACTTIESCTRRLEGWNLRIS